MSIVKRGILLDRLLAKGGIVAHFLNVAEGSAEQKVVVELSKLYRGLHHSLSAVVADGPRGHVRGGPRGGALVYDFPEKSLQLVKRINRLLARHPFQWEISPMLLADRAGEGPHIETGIYPYRGARRIRKFESERGWTDDEYYGAIEGVIRLADAGELSRLRKCGFCSKWLMASRTDLVYHEECAVLRHRKQRAASGISNEYMKWYRNYGPIKLRKTQLEEKQDDGFHLSKAERDELRHVTEKTQHLKDEWKATLKNLKGGNSDEKRRR